MNKAELLAEHDRLTAALGREQRSRFQTLRSDLLREIQDMRWQLARRDRAEMQDRLIRQPRRPPAAGWPMSCALSDAALRALYGKEARISRKQGYALVHLDKADQATIDKRTLEFDPQEFFKSDCPLCVMLDEGGVVVYDEDSNGDTEAAWASLEEA